MGYIITQSEGKVNVLDDIDVMIDEEKEEVFLSSRNMNSTLLERLDRLVCFFDKA